jgi:hypothetical protein
MRRMIAIAPLCLAAMAHGQCEPEWHIGTLGAPGLTFAGRAGVVNRMVAFDDGSGPALFASGVFDDASGESALGVGKWDGSAWRRLGSGIAGRITALGVFDDGAGMALYAGGNFLEAGGVAAGGVAKWDGEAWSALGEGIAGTPPARGAAFVMAVFDDGSGPALYVGGSFEFAGGEPAVNIARWDGSRWHNVGNATGSVNTLVVWDDGSGTALYAGGNLTEIGGAAVEGIARYDGSGWFAVGDGGLVGGDPPGRVNSMAVFDDGSGEKLYVGGSFDFAGGVPVQNIASWDGTDWAGVPAGGVSGGLSSAMAVYDDGVNGPGLYVGGSFDAAGGAPMNQIARLDAGGWSDVGEGVANPGSISTVSALIAHDDGSGLGPTLFVGGGYVSAGGQPAGSIARWGGCADSCYADCDGSGELDFFDFLCFQDAFAAGEPYADCDGSGDLDFFDFLCFQDAFAAGCP